MELSSSGLSEDTILAFAPRKSNVTVDVRMSVDRLCQRSGLSDVTRPSIAFCYTLQYV